MFAAYSRKEDSDSQKLGLEQEDKWLKNSSFTPNNEEQSQVFVSNNTKSDPESKEEIECVALSLHSLKADNISSSSTLSKLNTVAAVKTLIFEKSTNEKRKTKKKSVKSVKISHDLNVKQPQVSTKFRFSKKEDNLPTFYEDINGDSNNLAFPNMYSKSVARYHSLRTTLGKQFNRRKFDDKVKAIRYFSKKALKSAVMVSPNQSTQHINESNPLGIYDPKTLMYIQGQSDTNTTNAKTIVGIEMNFVQQTALLNEKLRDNPHDIELWLSFVEHQNLVSDSWNGEFPENKGKNLYQKALSERKMSIIDKAVELNPRSVKLLSARLKIAAEFWDTPSLHQEWRNTIFSNPSLIQLWNEYLSFLECRFEGFSVSSVLKTYNNCLQKLIQMLQPSFASHQKPPNIEEFTIDIVTRLCSFLRQSGWIEKSVSLIQALLELCFKRPHEDLFSSLGWLSDLWGSKHLRFGESDNICSPDQLLPSSISNEIDLSDAENDIISSGQSLANLWHQVECLRSRKHWQACPSSIDCDDEERFVSFSEISQYLFIFEKKSVLQYRQVVGCLLSLGVPLLPAGQAQLFWAPLVMEETIFQCLTRAPEAASLSSSSPNIVMSPSYLAFIRLVVLQSYSLLNQPFNLELALWWLDVERVRMTNLVNSSSKTEFAQNWRDTKRWIKQFLKNISATDSVSNILLYTGYAKIERETGNVEDSQRTLEMLLQTYSLNPLTMKPSQSLERAALLRTWFFYVRLLLLSGKVDSGKKALAHLVALGAGKNFSHNVDPLTPAMLLKAKRKYEATCEDLTKCSLSSSYVENPIFYHPDEVVEILSCFSYFLSLTDGCKAALGIIQCWLKSTYKSEAGIYFTFDNRFKADLIRYHTRRELVYVAQLELLLACPEWVKDAEPRLFHDVLCAALTEYPDSMHLLAMFIQSKEKFNMFSILWNNITLRAKSMRSSSSRAALAACLALANREDTIKKGEEKAFMECKGFSGGIPTLHLSYRRKMEHLVEHCVSHYPSCHNPVLWRILLRSAYLNGNSERCKSLFYRAVRDCPSSKDIYLDAVECVPDSLREVVNLLKEKDLRLRFLVEELAILLEDEKEDATANNPTDPGYNLAGDQLNLC